MKKIMKYVKICLRPKPNILPKGTIGKKCTFNSLHILLEDGFVSQQSGYRSFLRYAVSVLDAAYFMSFFQDIVYDTLSVVKNFWR